MVKLGKETFNCYATREYWPRVDVAYFDGAAETNYEKWSWEVAIEIESNRRRWHEDELCKLLVINAGLKVLIAYARSREEFLPTLKLLPDIYKSRKYVTSHCNWLFIFGPDNPHCELDFVAYKFDGMEVMPLPGTLISRPEEVTDHDFS